MKISLKNSLASLEVNTNGAYIDNFEVKDTAVFFPKVMVKIGDVLKIRGGMHVCAPNFGVDERLNTFHPMVLEGIYYGKLFNNKKIL